MKIKEDYNYPKVEKMKPKIKKMKKDNNESKKIKH